MDQLEVGTQTEAKPKVRRVHELDGLRGWAALAVVGFHYFAETFGQLNIAFITTPLKYFINGPLAVYIFFVLSGDALFTPLLQSKEMRVWREIVLRRYTRLSIPIFISTLLTYFVMKMGLMYNLQAAQIVHREDWLGRFLTFTPDLYYVFQYSFAGVYNWVYVDCNIYCYNNFLWSIGVEYVGSVFVLGIAPLFAFIRKPLFLAIIYMIVGFLLTSYCGVFAVGIICALMRENGTFQKYRENIFVALLSFVLFGLLVASDWYRQNYPNLTVANGDILFAMDKFWRTYFFEITSSLSVITIYFNKYLVLLLKTRFSQFLGFISFPIFLIQFGMLSSFESFLIVFLKEHINLFYIQLAIGFTTLAFSVFIAYYFAHIEGFILRKINQRLKYFTQ